MGRSQEDNPDSEGHMCRHSGSHGLSCLYVREQARSDSGPPSPGDIRTGDTPSAAHDGIFPDDRLERRKWFHGAGISPKAFFAPSWHCGGYFAHTHSGRASGPGLNLLLSHRSLVFLNWRPCHFLFGIVCCIRRRACFVLFAFSVADSKEGWACHWQLSGRCFLRA